MFSYKLFSLQITSGAGEQTKCVAVFRIYERSENLTMLSYSYCITGISKPADTQTD